MFDDEAGPDAQEIRKTLWDTSLDQSLLQSDTSLAKATKTSKLLDVFLRIRSACNLSYFRNWVGWQWDCCIVLCHFGVGCFERLFIDDCCFSLFGSGPPFAQIHRPTSSSELAKQKQDKQFMTVLNANEVKVEPPKKSQTYVFS
jgi:hypothetical protein